MLSESPESVIEDLIDLGVRVNEILPYHPTLNQLRSMRDGLMTLYRALEVFPIPQLPGLYGNAGGGFSRAIREKMK